MSTAEAIAVAAIWYTIGLITSIPLILLYLRWTDRRR